MTQDAVHKLLLKHPKGLTTAQIAKKLDQSKSTIVANLRRLIKYGEACYKINKEEDWRKFIWIARK